MSTKNILDKTIRVCLLFIVVTSVVVSLPAATGEPSPDSYNYKFIVNEDGFTQVSVTFQSTRNMGSSWVFVPKREFTPWTNITTSGEIMGYSFANTKDKVYEDYYFYEVFEFSFVSESSFEMMIQFKMSEAALIIEPRGIFFSPQIGFHSDSIGESEAEVFFPSSYTVNEELVASSSGVSTYTIVNSSSVLFHLKNNVERLQVEFETATTEPTWKQLNQSVFRFKAVKRYENYASEILSLFNTVYYDFTDLFNVTLEDIDVQFFIPEFETLLAVGGFIPFTGGTLGEININIFFIRAVNGTIQTIALHELIHHFLWKAGLSPGSFLWFHEGTAQFVSIETVDDLGYAGAVIERDGLEQSASQLIAQTGENFGFLQEWTPNNQPADVTAHYVASYYVVSRLAEEYGGLDFYKRFFEKIQSVKIETNDELAFHLSLAANASVDLKLKLWGFDIRLLYNGSAISPERIYEAEKAIDGLSPIFQPYKLIAESLYQQALRRLERGDVNGANQLLDAAISLANLAPLITLLTIAAILAVIVYVLHKHKSEPTVEPPQHPALEETTAYSFSFAP